MRISREQVADGKVKHTSKRVLFNDKCLIFINIKSGLSIDGLLENKKGHKGHKNSTR